jgi:hypothetical protein
MLKKDTKFLTGKKPYHAKISESGKVVFDDCVPNLLPIPLTGTPMGHLSLLVNKKRAIGKSMLHVSLEMPVDNKYLKGIMDKLNT